jgi:hypothetical protein
MLLVSLLSTIVPYYLTALLCCSSAANSAYSSSLFPWMILPTDLARACSIRYHSSDGCISAPVYLHAGQRYYYQARVASVPVSSPHLNVAVRIDNAAAVAASQASNPAFAGLAGERTCQGLPSPHEYLRRRLLATSKHPPT